MKKIIDNLIKLGLGAVDITEAAVRETVADLVLRGEMKKEEGMKLVTQLLEKMVKSKMELEKRVENVVYKAINKMNLVWKEDLQNALRELEEKMNTKISDHNHKDTR